MACYVSKGSAGGMMVRTTIGTLSPVMGVAAPQINIGGGGGTPPSALPTTSRAPGGCAWDTDVWDIPTGGMVCI